MLQQFFAPFICNLLPEVGHLQVFTESVSRQLIFTDEEEVLHLCIIQLFTIVKELHVQRLLKHVDEALGELNQIPIALLDVIGIHVHILLLSHFELDLFFGQSSEIAACRVEWFLDVPDEEVWLLLGLSRGVAARYLRAT